MSDEEELFAEEMRDVVPLPADGRATQEPAVRGPTLAQLARQRAAAAEDGDPNPLTLGEVRPVAPFDLLSWKRDGVQEGVFRKLRLGRYAMDASLDLHRRTVREARDDVWGFVEDGIRHGLRSVLIAHGRGDRGETPGRIKSYVSHWLQELDGVLAFHSAQRHHGGYGAVYVLLRKSAERRNDNRERFARRTP
ncbi:MAG TPA: DNA endonuclease SmrA [Pseudomonadales bacterium]|nr:DNA endonuclease SmrA [Pseudomonadales bacterium]